MKTAKPRVLCIATGCRDVHQFIQRFHPLLCDDLSLFVATSNLRDVGVESPFAILLADRTPIMRGWCVIIDAWADGQNRFRRPGIRIGLYKLTAASTQIVVQLEAAQAVTDFTREPTKREIPPLTRMLHARSNDQPRTPCGTAPPKQPMTITIPPKVTTVPKPSRPLADGSCGLPVVAVERAVEPPPVEVEPKVEVLPVNPFMDLTDETLSGYVECRIFDESGRYFAIPPIDAASPTSTGMDEVAIVIDTPQCPVCPSDEA